MSLYSEYRQSLKMVEVEEIIDLLVFRPSAFLFVKAVYRLPLTPNQLTIASMILGVAAGVFFGIGSSTAVLAGALHFAASGVLDCADGQLARMKHNGSSIGRLLDGMADYVTVSAIYVGIALSMARVPGGYGNWWWALCIAAGISHTFMAVLVDYYRTLFLDTVLERSSTFDEDMDAFRRDYNELRRERRSPVTRALIRAYLGYSRVQARLVQRRTTGSPQPTVPSAVYYRHNKIPIRLWTFIGTTTVGSFLIVCALLQRLDVFVWGLIIGGNLAALLLLAVQARAHRAMLRELEAR